jgi:hypothetical protein
LGDLGYHRFKNINFSEFHGENALLSVKSLIISFLVFANFEGLAQIGQIGPDYYF